MGGGRTTGLQPLVSSPPPPRATVKEKIPMWPVKGLGKVLDPCVPHGIDVDVEWDGSSKPVDLFEGLQQSSCSGGPSPKQHHHL